LLAFFRKRERERKAEKERERGGEREREREREIYREREMQRERKGARTRAFVCIPYNCTDSHKTFLGTKQVSNASTNKDLAGSGN